MRQERFCAHEQAKQDVRSRLPQLEWSFVRPANGGSAGHDFAPHFQLTLQELNHSIPEWATNLQ